MTINYTENLFETRYRDDYSDSDSYVRILFNNGRHLQARELTQSQTIIQKQIERLGRNIFKEGANVNPGSVSINNAYEFVKLDTGAYSLPNDGVVGETFLGQNSNVRVKVLEVVEAEGSDPATLYVEYTNTVSGTVGDTPIRLDAGEDLVGVNTGAILRVQGTDTVSNPAKGVGVKFSVDEGSFFVNGFFVHSTKQDIILSKYSPTYSGTVSFKVTQDIVTSDDDEDLYDNSQKLPNTTAPGADRFRIQLTLIDEADLGANDTSVYLAKIINSKVVDAVTGFNQYNKINELLALRTKEESGNYLVRPFKILFDSDDASNLKLNVSDGTAYVNGFRINKDYPTEISVARAQDTEEIENEVVAANYGNYVIASSLLGGFSIDVMGQVNLRDNATYLSGSTIGTARVRSIDKVGDGTYRIYLFNIAMNSGQNFRNVKNIGTDSQNNATLQLENSLAVLKDANNLNLLFELPNERPKNIDDISLTVQRKFNASVTSNSATISVSATGETFANTSDWIITRSDTGAVVTPTSITGSGTTSATINATLPGGTVLLIMAYVNKSVGTVKQKLKVTKTGSVSSLDSDNGIAYVDLAVPDVYAVNYIRQDSANGADISDQFVLDTGQRDAYYDISKLVVKGGIDAPSNVYYSVAQYEHTTSGDFFAVNSYSGTAYADIPFYTQNDGTIVDLRNVLDFRSVKNTSNTFSGGAARVHELPKNTDLITSDITYYLPRHDKVIVDENGTLSVLKGVSSLTPKFKDVPPNALELYRVQLNPFTLSDSDMKTQFIEAKGYTMQDIGLIEKRVTTLEKAVSLSLLELDTNALELIDSNGSPRTKAGFAVDNFTNHILSDTKNSEYRAAINPSEEFLTVAYSEKNVGLVYDSDASTNTVVKGDNVYIKYDEESYINQSQVSRTQNVNPFKTSLYNGTVILSPSSDEFRDTKTSATVVIQGGSLLDPRQELLSSYNEWGWNGVDRNSKVTSRVVDNQTIREIVGDRVIDIALVPFMRSRKVFFKAVGLKPNTRFVPFFDGVDVTSWCKSETFKNANDNTTEYGNTKANLTEHPDGSSNLFSDAKGEVSGSFFIPNTTAIRFRTGVKEFSLLDINKYDTNAASSVASATYIAEGAIATQLGDIVNTRRPNPPSVTKKTDPLAQSFYIAEDTGVFLTKVRLYFKTKSDTLPVWVQLRPMVNGAPSTEEIIPGSNKILAPANVTTSADGTSGTDFEFDEPIYLSPKTEYALVILSDADDYNVYISRMGDFELNSTQKRITKQPVLGSLYKPQNAADWQPAQFDDLMFNLYRADFATGTSTAYLENATIANKLLINDAVTTANGSSEITIVHKSNDFTVGDEVTVSGIVGNLGGFSQDSLNATHTITAVDGDGYTFDMDSTASLTTTGGGSNIIVNENMMMDKVYPYIETITPENTSVQFKGKFHSGKSLAGSETAYAEDATFAPINNKEMNYFATPKIIAHGAKETALTTSTAKLNIELTTSSGWVSPVVDLQRSSLTGISNRIDDQASAVTSGKNVPINYVAETNPTAGSHLSKHVTKPVTLVNDAVGLKIVFSANRPSVANIDVYYKAVGEDDKLEDVNWTLASLEADVPSDENKDVFRDYRYLVGGTGGSLTAFSVYQLKIVMRSTNSSKVPTIKDLQTIALGI